MILTILVILLVLALLGGAAPWHGYSRPYGWYPVGGLLGLVLLVLLILFLVGAL